MKKLTTIILVLLLSNTLSAQNGYYDTTFNAIGNSFYYCNEIVDDAVALPNGKTLMLGSHTISSIYGNEMSLIRINEDGSLDSSFGTNGVKVISTVVEARGIAMKLGNDSSIFLLGDDLTPGVNSLACIVKLDYDGNKLTSFGNNGEAVFHIQGGDMNIFDFDVDVSNGLFIIGDKKNTPWKSFVMRLYPTGVVDSTFGTDGVIYPSSGSSYDFYDVLVVDSNKVIVVGTNNGFAYTIMFNYSGQMNSYFGTNGVKQFQINNSNTNCRFVEMTSNKDFILAGMGAGVNYGGAWVTKMDINGHIDTNFAGGVNTYQYRIFAMDERICDITVNEDGETYFVVRSQGPFSGPNAYSHGVMLTLTKLLPSGYVDTAFGENGVFQDSTNTNSLGANTIFTDYLNRIIIIGKCGYNQQDAFMMRIEGRKNQQLIISDTSIVKYYGDSLFQLNAIATSGQNCTFTISDNTIATNTNQFVQIQNAGITTINIVAQGNVMYSPACSSIPLTINKKELLIKPKDTARVINTVNPKFVIEYQGFVYGDAMIDLDSLPLVTTTANLSSPIGNYPIFPFGGYDNNYEYIYAPAYLTIYDPLGLNPSTKDQNTLHCYPNPTQNILNIDLIEGDQSLELIDVSGRVVYYEHIPNVSNKIFQINVEQLQPGIYSIILRGNDEIRKARLIIK